MAYTQSVLSTRKRVFVERYLTATGKRLLASAKTKAEKEAIWNKYGKNRYRNNPKTEVLTQIKHY